MNGMKLAEPSMEYDAQIQAYRKEFLEYGGSIGLAGSPGNPQDSGAASPGENAEPAVPVYPGSG